MSHSKAIILIDDDEFLHFTFGKQLKLHNYAHHLVDFNDVTSALDYFEHDLSKQHFSQIVTLLDINMPVLDGWDFLENIEKKIWPSLDMPKKLFMLSSSVDCEDINYSKVFKTVSGYIQKPLDSDAVKQILVDNDLYN